MHRSRTLVLLLVLALPHTAPAAATPGAAAHPEVLIVVNGASPVSVAIGDYYRAKRNVPAANVVALQIPLADPTLRSTTQEAISSVAAFETRIRAPIEAFLTQHDLIDTIEIIVLTSGVPHRFAERACPLDGAYPRDCSKASVDAELAVFSSKLVGAGGIGDDGEAVNPYFDSTQSFAAWRKAHPEAPLRYLVARLAGFPTPLDPASGVPVDVKSLIDGAQATPPRDATVLIDEDPAAAVGRRVGNPMLLRPIATLLRGRGVPVVHDESPLFVASPAPLLGYASWGSNDSQSGAPPFYGKIEGRLVPGAFAPRSIVVDLVSTNGRTFVSTEKPTGQSLAADLIHLGASGVAANAFEPLLIGLARPSILFRNYFQGTIAIESFYRSVPYLSWMNVYLGDPLMTSPVRIATGGDSDGDGVPDARDNCVYLPNRDQRDTNGDGFGNLCDADFDGDGRVRAGWSALPAGASDDLKALERAIAQGRYDPDLDLDGDRDVDVDDAGIASLWLFLPPGPSGTTK